MMGCKKLRSRRRQRGFIINPFSFSATTPIDGAPPSAVDFEKRWLWMRYPYAAGRTSDVTDASEFDQRSWMGI